jgi:thiol peroxidase
MQRTGFLTFKGKPITLVGKTLNVGEQAPNFTVIDVNLEPVSLSNFSGKNVLISVAPSLETSICAAQTRRFNEVAAALNNTVVLSISVDLPFSLNRFCTTEGIENVKALSDHRDLDFAMKYGFLAQELRLLARGVVLIDANNTVRYIEYVPEIAQHPDYDKALSAAQAL